MIESPVRLILILLIAAIVTWAVMFVRWSLRASRRRREEREEELELLRRLADKDDQ